MDACGPTGREANTLVSCSIGPLLLTHLKAVAVSLGSLITAPQRPGVFRIHCPPWRNLGDGSSLLLGSVAQRAELMGRLLGKRQRWRPGKMALTSPHLTLLVTLINVQE